MNFLALIAFKPFGLRIGITGFHFVLLLNAHGGKVFSTLQPIPRNSAEPLTGSNSGPARAL